LLNKRTLTLSKRKYHIVSTTLLVFVDASENLVMANNVATPSNPLVSLVKKEKLEETRFDVNDFQRSHEKKLSKKGIVDRFLIHMP
jgi:hypothetical protein